ncbi:MAG: hypothetical protein MZU97_00465 [Bacillus subtilis]|nr:hypothetical protein [Bacillus subtilis]
MTKKLLIIAIAALFAVLIPQPRIWADAQYFQDDTPYSTYTVDYEGNLDKHLDRVSADWLLYRSRAD